MSTRRDPIEEPSDNDEQDQLYKWVLVCLRALLGLLLACAVITFTAFISFVYTCTGAAILHYPSITHTYRRYPWSAATYSPTPPFMKAAVCGSAISSPVTVLLVALGVWMWGRCRENGERESRWTLFWIGAAVAGVVGGALALALGILVLPENVGPAGYSALDALKVGLAGLAVIVGGLMDTQRHPSCVLV
ncbi:hypothetical protein C8Q76DRAFT_140840 [Earliella scabrosa]|nr:hypothetical protein C8Q76DRAFT_140840 [Earliella scabrosa]